MREARESGRRGEAAWVVQSAGTASALRPGPLHLPWLLPLTSPQLVLAENRGGQRHVGGQPILAVPRISYFPRCYDKVPDERNLKKR